jgi:hypothetical protein
MANSKKQHYLPQFYLRGFHSSGASKNRQKIWSISKTAEAICTEDLVRNTAYEENFYSVEKSEGTIDGDSIERQLSKLEDIYASVRAKILNAETIDATDRNYLSRFICLMHARQPVIKEAIANKRTIVAKEFMRSLNKGDVLLRELEKLPKFKNWPAPELEEFARRMRMSESRVKVDHSNGSLLGHMFAMAFDPQLISIYDNMAMEVFEAPPSSAFITGDQPVARFDPATPSRPEIALTHPDVEVTFPLSSKKLLRFSWKHSPTVRDATTDEVDEFNRRTVIMATKLLFASRHDEALLQIIQKNHAYRAGFDCCMLPLADNKGGILFSYSSVRPPNSH